MLSEVEKRSRSLSLSSASEAFDAPRWSSERVVRHSRTAEAGRGWVSYLNWNALAEDLGQGCANVLRRSIACSLER